MLGSAKKIRHIAAMTTPATWPSGLARAAGGAISAFLARFQDYRLCGPVVRGGRVRFRGYLRVPLSLGLPIESWACSRPAHGAVSQARRNSDEGRVTQHDLDVLCNP